MKKTIVLIIMLACSTMLMAQRESKRVLFIGNSYTYVNDLPQLLQRVAEMMREKGVTQALNLDGGNTMALIFRGRMLNKLATYKRKNFVRTVTSLIGIGTTENQEY